MDKEFTKNEKDLVRKLQALPLEWGNAFGITPETMVSAKVAQAFLKGEEVVMTARPTVAGRAVGDAVMVTVSARDGSLDITRTSYEKMLRDLPVDWKAYAAFGVTPEAIMATGRMKDLVEGRDIRMEVEIAGEKADKVITYIRSGKDGPYISMDTPFEQKHSPKVFYGSGEKDSYEVFEQTRKELLEGKVVCITPKRITEDRPEVVAELSPAGRLRYKRVDVLLDAIQKTSLGKLLTSKQLDAYVHGQPVTPKGWKSAIHYSPVEGGFAYEKTRKKAEVAQESVAPTEAVTETTRKTRGHAR